MSELEHEKAFEEYLSRRGIGGSTGHSDGLEPPPELDRIVLARAREAIRVRSAPPPFRGVRWALPVSLAATVVLSFAILMHLGLLPRPSKDGDQPIEAHFHPDPAASTDSAADTAMSAPPSVVLDMPARADAPKATQRKKESAQEPRPSQAEERRAMQAQSAAERDEEISVAGNKSEVSADRMAGAASGALEDPAAWLRRIEALRAQGKTAEADREWQAFRKAWPDYPASKAPPR